MTQAISISRVTKRFETPGQRAVVALQDVSLDIADGELISLVGPSGCGKTTLLRIIAGLETVTTGKVTIGGTAVYEPSPAVGFVFQHAVLLPWLTVLDNVLLPVRVRRLLRDDYIDRAKELLETSGIAGFADHYPGQLSGGMRQRAAICRALLLDPAVLLLDEPFGALDAMTRDTMNGELFRLWQDTSKTIVLVTHSITEAVTLSTRSVVMSPRPGKVDEVRDFGLGTHGSLADRISQPEFGWAVRELRSHFESDAATPTGEVRP